MTMRTWLNNLWTLSIITPLPPYKMLEISLLFLTKKFLEAFSRERNMWKTDSRVFRITLSVLTQLGTLSLKKNCKMNTVISSFKKKCFGYRKSQEKWTKFGDKNNFFFHAQNIKKRKKNRIHRLQLPNGTWTSDDTILQPEAQNYFKILLVNTQPHHNRTFHHGHHPTTDEPSKLSLTNPITKTEVFTALNSMKPYKAFGPDGFQCIFFRQYWHTVGDDIFQLVQSAFQTGYFDPENSNTLIALIPKIDTPNTYKDFRPISLCNTVYKIITKVLVHRLRPILNKKSCFKGHANLCHFGTC